jgi:hypothetical protein
MFLAMTHINQLLLVIDDAAEGNAYFAVEARC